MDLFNLPRHRSHREGEKMSEQITVPVEKWNNLIAVVKADTLSVRWEPPNVNIIKADTIWHKGKVE